MKKILILFFLPIFSFAQEASTDNSDSKGLIFGVNYGINQDLLYSDEDINTFSGDMSSEILDSEKGYQISVAYKYEKITFGVNFSNGKLKGENEVEYFNSDFSERNLYVEYDIFKKSKYEFFISGSYGEIDYESKRFLLYDDTELTINSPSGTSTKRNFGGGVRIYLADNFLLVFSSSLNLIDDDGLDGWDYGTDLDKYSFHSLGLRYYLNL